MESEGKDSGFMAFTVVRVTVQSQWHQSCDGSSRSERHQTYMPHRETEHGNDGDHSRGGKGGLPQSDTGQKQSEPLAEPLCEGERLTP